MRMGLAAIAAAMVVALGVAAPARGSAPAPEAWLARFERQVVATPADAPDRFDVRLTLDGAPVTLRLEKRSLRAEGFRLLAAGADGRARPVAAPEVRTYRGDVVGLPGATAAASLSPDGLTALVLGPDGESWHVEPAPDGAPGEHLVYRGRDARPLEGVCGADERYLVDAPPAPGGAARGDDGCNRLCEIAFDADHEFYQLNGASVDATVADIEAVMNGVDLIYARDTNVRFAIVATVVRTAEPDPYTASDAGDLLNQFRMQWNNHHGDIARDTAHLMTGRDLDGSTIGIAWVGVLCGTGLDYGLSQSRWTGGMAARVALTAHEVGHNFSAAHCNGDPDCYIMCSGLGGCAHDLTRFGARSMDSIRAHSLARPCLSAAPGYPEPLAPRVGDDLGYTAAGLPVTIDVLANDHDGNCDELLIGWHAPTSEAGGLVERSGGTGPGGREELRYTPPPGFTGTDRFNYTAYDGYTVSPGTVRVEVVALRPAVAPGGSAAGLDATYYDLSLWRLPHYAGDGYATDTVATIDFPPTDGAFATSGRADHVGAVFTGTLNVAAPGAYTFYLRSDEGSRLLVDGQVVVNHDGLHGMTERSGQTNLGAGSHAVRVEYFEATGPAGLVVSVEGPGLARQVIPPSMWSPPGVGVEYFDLSPPSAIPDLDLYHIAGAEIVPQINFPAGNGPFAGSGLVDELGASFEGYLVAPTDGLYRLFTESDDGSRLWMGPDLIVDNDGPHGMQERAGVVGLEAGAHPFRVEFFEAGGAAGLIARVEGPELPKQIIPASMLFRAVCAADFDGDGALTPSDFAAFRDAFLAGDPRADFNGDGTPDAGDFAAFRAAFLAGCS